VDVEKHALIYACAQKNIGIAGLTVVILRPDLVGHALPFTPRMLDYRYHVENASMFNTPCTFAVYVAGLVLKWIIRNGGLEGMAARHEQMARKVYDVLDSSALFRNHVLARDRSRINIPFKLTNPELEGRFLAYAEENGIAHLRGNLALGLRASMYNAMEIEGVDRLVQVMTEFERAHA
jgi:phosphoserine aminotransferase